MNKVPEKKGRRRLIIALILVMAFLAFILINAEYKAGIIFLILTGISSIIVFNWDKIPKKHPERKLFSFDDNWIQDGIFGVFVGLGVVFLMTLLPIGAIAVPQAPQSGAFPETFATAGQYLTVVGGASLAEEFFFRVVLFGVLWSVIDFGFFPSAFLTSLAFSLFHINAYAGELALNPILAVSGAFISAFLVGLLLVYLNKARGSVSASIGTHSAINGGILSQNFVVVG